MAGVSNLTVMEKNCKKMHRIIIIRIFAINFLTETKTTLHRFLVKKN